MANEKRLIDANALLECLDALEVHGGHLLYRNGCNDMIQDLFPKIVNDQTTVDAVGVDEHNAIVSKLENLLCHATGGKYSKAGYAWKDMERMVTDYIEECCEEAVAEQVVWCNDCDYYEYGKCRFWNAEIHPDNFCSFGERKDNETV